MADEKSWFPKSLKKGKLIKSTEPVASRWKIVEKVNEHVDQSEDTNLHLSLASAKFLCRDANDPANKTDTYLRIIQQIPSAKAEASDVSDCPNRPSMYNMRRDSIRFHWLKMFTLETWLGHSYISIMTRHVSIDKMQTNGNIKQ